MQAKGKRLSKKVCLTFNFSGVVLLKSNAFYLSEIVKKNRPKGFVLVASHDIGTCKILCLSYFFPKAIFLCLSICFAKVND